MRNDEFADVSGFVEIEEKEGVLSSLKLFTIIGYGMCILEVQEEILSKYIAHLVQVLLLRNNVYFFFLKCRCA